MVKKQYLVFTLIMVSALTACRASASPTARASPARSPAPTQALTISFTLERIEATSPPRTSIVEAIPTPACTHRPTHTPPPTPTRRHTRTHTPTDRFTRPPTITATADKSHLNDMYPSILEALNQGAPISMITETLQTEGVLIQTWQVDFDGDSAPEILTLATVYNAANRDFENGSGVWVFMKSPAGYQTVFSFQMSLLGEMRVIAVEDVNQDALPEVLIAGTWSSPMMACDTIVLVLGWQAGRVIDFFDQRLDTCDADIALDEPDLNGNRPITIENTDFYGLGGGPGRTHRDSYSLHHGKYMLSTTQLLPSKYRFHVLQDAQIAYRLEDYEAALQLWDQAAHDETLINYPSQLLEEDQPEIYQPAYALYRVYTTYLILGDAEKAQKVFDEISSTYPAEAPGSEFIGVALKIKALLAVNQDPEILCPAINEYVEGNYGWGFRVMRWYWGVDFQLIVDFCPIER